MAPPPDARLIATMTTLPAAPQNLRLFHSELSGVITVRFKPERSPSSNEVQVNLGGPNDEAGWVQKPLIRGGKAELTGLAPGIVVWVRVRTIGLNGVMGVWNDPAQIRTARCEGGAWCGASRWLARGRPSRSPHENNSPLTTPPFAVSFLLLIQGWVGSSARAGPRGRVDWIGLG
jgi:hypothetical protein